MSSNFEKNQTPEIENREKTLDFIWHTTADNFQIKQVVSLTPRKEYAYSVYSAPLPEKISKEELERLKSYTASDGKEYLYCGYGNFDLEKACKMEPNMLPSLTYYNEMVRKDEIVKPLKISEQEVADVIKHGRVIIYTGAGISVAAGTPDMKDLMSYLGIHESKEIDDFTRTILFSPEEIHNKLMHVQKSLYKNPTYAHIALAKIQKLTNVPIVTENLDALGERAGQELITRPHIERKFPDESILSLDSIITVGLGTDDSGLLYRYKKINPNGRIIALNITAPSYLTGKDYYLEGDVQATVPHIAEIISG